MPTEAPTPPPSPPAPESVFTAEGSPPPGRVATEPPEQKTKPSTAEDTAAAKATKADAADAAGETAPPAEGTATQPVSRSARIVGAVELRQGDGTVYEAPRGWCKVQITALDATLSWVDHSAHGPAAMPLDDFNRYLLAGAIVYADTATD